MHRHIYDMRINSCHVVYALFFRFRCCCASSSAAVPTTQAQELVSFSLEVKPGRPEALLANGASDADTI